MMNIDCYGNITCHVGDRMVIDFGFHERDKLESTDKITFTVTFNNIKTEKIYTPDSEGVVKIFLISDKSGTGSYSLMVTKEDLRQEVIRKGTITIY